MNIKMIEVRDRKQVTKKLPRHTLPHSKHQSIDCNKTRQIHWQSFKRPKRPPTQKIKSLVQHQETNRNTHKDQQQSNCQKPENTISRRNGQKTMAT